MANILVNPSAINLSPWFVSGTGASATSATTLQTASSGSTSISQTVTVTASTSYTASVTVAASSGPLFFAIYPTDFSTTYGSQTVTLTTSPQTLSFTSSIPAGVTSAIFELDFDSSTGLVATITNAQFNSPSVAKHLLSLLGCGS